MINKITQFLYILCKYILYLLIFLLIVFLIFIYIPSVNYKKNN